MSNSNQFEKWGTYKTNLNYEAVMKQVMVNLMNEIGQNGEKLIAHFYNPWSSQYKMLEPLFESLQMDYSNIKIVNNANNRFAKN